MGEEGKLEAEEVYFGGFSSINFFNQDLLCVKHQGNILFHFIPLIIDIPIDVYISEIS